MPRAVVLLSGGLDSAVTAAVARSRGFEWYALSVDYGQRHRYELDASRKVAKSLGARDHMVVSVDLSRIGGSALTADLPVPKDRAEDVMAQGIPITYVPARNTVLLSIGLGYAETLAAADLFVGVNAVDYSGYPDCRPEYLAAFEKLANLATKAGVERTLKFTIHAPLIDKTKADIIRTGASLGVDFALTHSCYDPDLEGRACGHCDSCLIRSKGFADAGLSDPTRYAP